MNWSVPIIAFCVAVMVAAWLDARLQRRGASTRRRRILKASLALPVLITVASGCGIAFELLRAGRVGDNMTDLAVAVIIAVGALFAFVTWIGGLIGASLAEERRQ